MKYELRVFTLVFLLAMLTGACALFDRKPVQRYVIPEQERNFAGALEFLRIGNEEAALGLLERVINAPPVVGITDEAMFRMALFALRDEAGKNTERSKALLLRLKNEYPHGIWTAQSIPLSLFLEEVKTIRSHERELKKMRSLNLSLTSENRELHQIIERLKVLDIELEQKNRR